MNKDTNLLAEAYLKIVKEGWREDEGNYPVEGDDEESYRSNRQYAKSGSFSKASDNAAYGSHNEPKAPEAPKVEASIDKVALGLKSAFSSIRDAIGRSAVDHSLEEVEPDIQHIVDIAVEGLGTPGDWGYEYTKVEAFKQALISILTEVSLSE
jgi:hypothetical protein